MNSKMIEMDREGRKRESKIREQIFILVGGRMGRIWNDMLNSEMKYFKYHQWKFIDKTRQDGLWQNRMQMRLIEDLR